MPALLLLPVLPLIASGGCSHAIAVDRWPMASATSSDGERFVAYAMPPEGFGLGLTTHVVGVRDHVTAITPLPGRGAMVFTPRNGFDVGADEDLWCTQPGVRDAAALGSTRLALIVGGDSTASSPEEPAEPPPWLRSGEVRLACLRGDHFEVGGVELAATAHPWRLRVGRFAGEDDALLILVYTRAPFDDTMRRRPWIFRVTEDDDGLPRLDPRWRGTSFAHPFRDATFGDFTGADEGEIAALEVREDGGRMLTAYRFEGFGLEGVAPGAQLPPVEDRVEAAHWVGGESDELVVRALDGTFLFYELDDAAQTLREVLTIDGPATVLGWIVTGAQAAEPGELICVLPGGEIWRTTSSEHR